MAQIDLLLKQVLSSLDNLTQAIEKFEKYPAPSTQYTEQLHDSLQESNKLVSAYLVLKEQKDISPDLDLHMKLMTIPSDKETVMAETMSEAGSIETITETNPAEAKPIEPIKEAVAETILPIKTEPLKTYPTLTININDKFRFINELFKSNSAEYIIAIEELNTIGSPEDANAYLKGLKAIYDWDENHEMVKKLTALTQKRFA